MRSLFTPADLADIAARATTLDERRGFLPYSSEHAHGASGLDRWRQTAAAGDHDIFERRLRCEGLTSDEARSLLQAPPSETASAACPWLRTFHWAVDAMAAGGTSGPLVDANRAIPFDGLLSGAVEAARAYRGRRFGIPKGLSDSALATMDRRLLVKLAELLAPGLYQEFSLYRIAERKFGMHFAAEAAQPASSEVYQGFLGRLRAGGLLEFFCERPVLARLVATAVEQWVEGTGEALVRLGADLRAIRRAFPHASTARTCIAVRPAGSDPHRGGREVLIFEFDNHFRVVYKPRDLGMDAAWGRLLADLRREGAPPAARCPRVLVRDGYGWNEWIPAAPSSGPRAARAFFSRSGAVLCLLYLLQAADIHFENVIASGCEPAVVDLESLLHPGVADELLEEDFAVRRAAEARLRESVLATLYLPHWEAAAPGRIIALGGLSATIDYAVARPRFQNVNTDAMHVRQRVEHTATADNLPTAAGRPLSSGAHAREICAGFAAMYRYLLRHRRRLARPAGPLSGFRGRTVRVLLRPTQLYYLLLKRSQELRNVGDGAEWSLHFDFLSRLYEWDANDSRWTPLLRAEREALAQMDIPEFHTRTDSTDLHQDGKLVMAGVFGRPACDEVCERLALLSEAGLEGQLRYIRQALESEGAGVHRRPVCYRPTGRGAFSPAFAVDCAAALARNLAAEAILAEGAAAWLAVGPVGDGERAQVKVLGHELYSGTTGLALFFAALARATGDGEFRGFSMAALRPTLSCLAHPGKAQRLARRIGIGGGTGIGSVVYALVQVSRLLDDPSLLPAAVSAAELISADRIAADRKLDAISGSAGAILCLLRLYQEAPQSWILERAAAAGRRLLAAQVFESTEGGRRRWPANGDGLLAGMSHGASGIAYALASLYRATGEAELLAAVRNTMAYERSICSVAQENSLRQPPAHGRPACAWCYGAAGIALARLGIARAVEDDAIRADLDLAAARTVSEPAQPYDNLCCGNMGRIETLFTLGLGLAQPRLVDTARSRAVFLARRAQRTGGWGWQSGGDDMNPGFFNGMAGIGYTLLRLAYPEMLPAVLVWE